MMMSIQKSCCVNMSSCPCARGDSDCAPASIALVSARARCEVPVPLMATVAAGLQARAGAISDRCACPAVPPRPSAQRAQESDRPERTSGAGRRGPARIRPWFAHPPAAVWSFPPARPGDRLPPLAPCLGGLARTAPAPCEGACVTVRVCPLPLAGPPLARARPSRPGATRPPSLQSLSHSAPRPPPSVLRWWLALAADDLALSPYRCALPTGSTGWIHLNGCPARTNYCLQCSGSTTHPAGPGSPEGRPARKPV